ncbi:MAG TPA: hypothetical protein VMS17_09395 [Gemmataceae bacterium]|nr:hypothetical protein [Gemmataceae bacterium]
MTSPLFLPLIVALGLIAVAVAAAVGLVVLVAVLRRPSPPVYGVAVRPTFSTPMARAQAAASALTPDEWEEFRRWTNGARPASLPAGNSVAR